MKLISYLNISQNNLTGYQDGKILKLSNKDIFYLESVDNAVCAYEDKEVYKVHKKCLKLKWEYRGMEIIITSGYIIYVTIGIL